MNTKKRYAGKPFIRLLECYVLRSIGELSLDEDKKLRNMEPTLHELYELDGSWYEIIESVMEFPSSLPSQIDTIWKKNQKLAELNNEELVPNDFAELFVDHNFQAG